MSESVTDAVSDRDDQRRGAVRTALVLAAIAIGIYVWAIFSRI